MTWVAAGITVAEAAAAAEAIAIAEAAAAAAAAAETAAATAAAAETASAGITAAEAASALPEIIAPGAEAGAQGILQAAPEAANVAAEGSNAAAQQVQEQAVKQGLEQAVNPDQAMFEEMQRQMAQESANPTNFGPGTQYASANGPTPVLSNSGATSVDPFGGFPSSGPDLNASMNSFNEISQIPNVPANTTPSYNASLLEEASSVVPPNTVATPPPANPFMQAYEGASKYVETNPWKTGLGAYGLLSATGALQQKGASPPGQRTFNNPYHFSKDFQGTHPNPNDYQYAPKYPSYAMGGIAGMIDQLTGKSQKTSNAANLSPNFKRGEVDPNDYQYTPRYAMGGITDIPPQTNFANPAASDMGTSQYSMATDPMSGNIANRMAEGGVTGSGQMQLNVPINVGGAGGGDLGGGGGYGGFGGGGGYAPPGGPQGGGSGLGSLTDMLKGRQINPLQQALIGPTQPTAQLLGPTQSPPLTSNDPSIMSGAPVQRGLGGKGGFSQQPADNTGKGMGFARGGKTDIYDASLRFADIMDNPNRYSPPDTRFQSVETFRDTNPNTATKSPDEAAETRRKAIEQRSYVNTGAKYLPASRRPGQLDLGPVGGERGKYDNQESVLAAQGGIMGYNLGGYASGGNPRLLRGPGDGMSDNIPATIADRQPARLADGEFVIPADVVSHLGNGSTEAGAKKLHEMMNSVRKARTGNPKQGKKINPSKFMPKK